jgi:hypothetical protein
VPEPVRLVESDDPIVADLLMGTLQLVAEAGGWVSPGTRLVAHGGQLSLAFGGDEDVPLLRIPREAWVRVDRVTWADDAERLTVASPPDDVGDIELEMLYTQVALHNQCGKLDWLARTHPSLAPDLPDGLVRSVRRLVPGFRTGPASAVDLFLANRCFRVDLGDGAGTQRVLIPVVDLLNHRSGGATGTWDGAAFHVTARRPFGDHECALDYGMDRDAVEMAVVYGFVDPSVEVAHSVPVSADVPGLGSVRVSGTGRSASGALLDVTADRTGAGTVITRIAFRRADRRATVTETAAATGWDEATTRAALHALARANLLLLEETIEQCRTAPQAPAVQTIAAAARHQAGILADW